MDIILVKKDMVNYFTILIYCGEGEGLATSDPLAQMTQLALILLQPPSRQLNCSSTQVKIRWKWFYYKDAFETILL